VKDVEALVSSVQKISRSKVNKSIEHLQSNDNSTRIKTENSDANTFDNEQTGTESMVQIKQEPFDESMEVGDLSESSDANSQCKSEDNDDDDDDSEMLHASEITEDIIRQASIGATGKQKLFLDNLRILIHNQGKLREHQNARSIPLASLSSDRHLNEDETFQEKCQPQTDNEIVSEILESIVFKVCTELDQS